MAAVRPGHLVRSLTLVPATAIIVANVIGTGVFVKARAMTCNVETPGMALLVWVLAGLLALSGAIVYAELATLIPRAGGDYNYLGAAYGRGMAFFYGWTRMLAQGASDAAVAIVFVIFLNDLCGDSLPPVALRLLPLAVIGVVALINLGSARSNGILATVMFVAKVALVLGVGLGAFLLADGSWGHLAGSAAGATCSDVPASARGGITGFGAAMLGALWAYEGWSQIVAVAGEVKRPGWTLPRAMIGGTTLVIALYVLINAAYYYVLTPQEVGNVSASSSVASEVATRFLGAGTAMALAAALMLSSFGTLHTSMIGSPRLPYALARSRMLPGVFARVSSRGSPVIAVLAVAVWDCAVALSGTFDALTDMFVFVLWVFYAVTVTTLFVLRRSMPDAPRPYRAWGYPVVPVLFLLAAVYLAVNTLVATPGRALAGLALMASGIPVYWLFARRAPPIPRAMWIGDDAQSG